METVITSDLLNTFICSSSLSHSATSLPLFSSLSLYAYPLQLIRIRCPDGNFRYQLDPTDTADKLIDSVSIRRNKWPSQISISSLTRHPSSDSLFFVSQLLKDTPNADPTTLTFSNDPRGGEMIASSLRGTTIGDLGLS